MTTGTGIFLGAAFIAAAWVETTTGNLWTSSAYLILAAAFAYAFKDD